MEIKIASRHGQLSDANQQIIREKLSKLPQIFDRLTEIEVTVDLADSTKLDVHLQVQAEHKHDFVATYQSDNLMGAVDQVLHKMETQIRRYKDKIQNHHNTPASGEPH